jgi:hypothetical protein
MSADRSGPDLDEPDVSAVEDQAVALDMLLVDGALWPSGGLRPS